MKQALIIIIAVMLGVALVGCAKENKNEALQGEIKELKARVAELEKDGEFLLTRTMAADVIEKLNASVAAFALSKDEAVPYIFHIWVTDDPRRAEITCYLLNKSLLPDRPTAKDKQDIKRILSPGLDGFNFKTIGGNTHVKVLYGKDMKTLMEWDVG